MKSVAHPRPLRVLAYLLALAALPSAQAGEYTFVGGGGNSLWSNAGNWLNGAAPNNQSYDDVLLGLNTSSSLLRSRMDFSFVALRNLFFDQKGGVSLTGNLIRMRGGGSLVVGANASSIDNAVRLNDNSDTIPNMFVSVASGGILTATGSWSGAGGFTKTGAGTLFLINDNSYTGSSIIEGGLVKIGHDGALAGANLSLTSGSLDLNGYNPSVASLVMGSGTSTSAGTVSGAGKLTLGVAFRFLGNSRSTTASAIIDSNLFLTAGVHAFGGNGRRSRDAYDAVFSGVISGHGGLDKQDNFTMVVTGKGTYGGETSVSGGRLFVGVDDALPTDTELKIGSGGYVSLRTYSAQAGVVAGSFSQTVGALSGSGVLDLGAKGLTVGGLNTSTAFSGSLRDQGYGGSLTKVGTGVLTLSGQNAFTGGTTIKAGTIRVGSDAALGGATGDVTLAGGTLDLNGVSSTVRNLSFGDGVATGDLDKVVDGTLKLAGDVSFNPAARSVAQTIQTDASLVLLAGQHAFGTNGLGKNAYDFALKNLSGAGGIDVRQGASLAFVGEATYQGATNVTDGLLTVATTDALPTNTALTLGAGGTLSLNPVSEGRVLGGSYSQRVGSLAGAGAVELGRATLAVVGDGAGTAFSGRISGAGNLVKSGSARLDVAGADLSGLGGRIQVGGGTLAVRPNSHRIDLAGGTLELAGSGAQARVAGSGNLLKTGAGAAFLLEAPTFSGTTTVAGGSLIASQAGEFAGPLSVAGGAAFSNASGSRVTIMGTTVTQGEIATFAGSTTVFKKLVSGAGGFSGFGEVEFDGGYHPGNSPASVLFQGDMRLGGANELVMELGGTTLGTGYDHLTVQGTAFLGGSLSVRGYGGFQASAGQSFDLFDFSTTQSRFASVSLPALTSGLAWNSSALYTTGRLSVEAVPEPGSLIALGLGGLALLRRRKTHG